MQLNKIYTGDCLEWLRQMPDNFIDCCVTSPPYFGLRDYLVAGQIGLEETPELYVAKLVEVFTDVKRVLKKEGTLWLNLGDSYAANGNTRNGEGEIRNLSTSKFHGGNAHLSQRRTTGKFPNCKPKDLIGIPWMLAFALRADGWYLRQDIIWHKPNPMPESVTDRCTKAHEYIFLLAKSGKYYYDQQAIFEAANYDGRKDTIMKGSAKYQNGFYPTDVKTQSIAVVGHERWKNKIDDEIHARNKRSVWTVTTKPFSEAHFATFPEDLISDCIKAGCPENGTVLDPFMGAGTTAIVAKKLNRNYIGIELNESYVTMANKRLYNEIGLFL